MKATLLLDNRCANKVQPDQVLKRKAWLGFPQKRSIADQDLISPRTNSNLVWWKMLRKIVEKKRKVKLIWPLMQICSKIDTLKMRKVLPRLKMRQTFLVLKMHKIHSLMSNSKTRKIKISTWKSCKLPPLRFKPIRLMITRLDFPQMISRIRVSKAKWNPNMANFLTQINRQWLPRIDLIRLQFL